MSVMGQKMSVTDEDVLKNLTALLAVLHDKPDGQANLGPRLDEANGLLNAIRRPSIAVGADRSRQIALVEEAINGVKSR